MHYFAKYFEKNNYPVIPETIPSYKKITDYVINTNVALVSQIVVAPRAIYNFFEEDSNKIIHKNLQETFTYAIPFIFISAVTNYLFTCISPSAPMLSFESILYLSLILINLSINTILLPRFIHNSITTLCAPKEFTPKKITKNLPKEKYLASLCKPDCKKQIQILNTAIYQTTAYYSNFAIIHFLSYMPTIGSFLAKSVSVHFSEAFVLQLTTLFSKTPFTYASYLGSLSLFMLSALASGRYIGELTTSHCIHHQFLQSEATLSLGMFYKGVEYLFWKICEISIGLPPFFLAQTLNQLPLLFIILIAAHYETPLVAHNSRTIIDPIELYEKYFSENILPKIKILMKNLFNGPPSIVPWDKIALYFFDCAKYLHIKAQPITPPMLQSFTNFINEPMIKPQWVEVSTLFIDKCKTIEIAYNSSIVHAVQKIPPIAAAYLFHLALGAPLPIIYFILDVLSDEQKMLFINKTRLWLEKNQPWENTGLKTLSTIIPLKSCSELQLQSKNLSVAKPKEVFEVQPQTAANNNTFSTSNIHRFLPGPTNKLELADLTRYQTSRRNKDKNKDGDEDEDKNKRSNINY